MAVAHLPALRPAPVGLQRRAFQVEATRIKFFHLLWQKLTEKYIISLLHLLIDFGRIFLLPPPVAHTLVNLIIAAPHGQRRMVAQTTNVIFRFRFYTTQKGRVMGISGASEHEVLPHQDATSVGFLKERIVLVDTAAPHTHHIHIGRLHILQQTAVALARNTWQQRIRRNQVCTFGKHRHPVHFEVKTLAVLVFFLHYTYRTQANLVTLL